MLPYRECATVLDERAKEAIDEQREVLAFARGLRRRRSALRAGLVLGSGLLMLGLASAVFGGPPPRHHPSHLVEEESRLLPRGPESGDAPLVPFGCTVMGDVFIGFPMGPEHPCEHQSPILQQGSVEVSGALPKEVIQRIVRQNFGRFRLCYEVGLRTNPGLAGEVSVRFVIDRQGSVAVAADHGSDLPDPQVTSCVVRAFSNLSFPEPQGSAVTVTYPILMRPSP